MKNTFILLLLITTRAFFAQPVTTESLLKEMIDRDKIARYPSNDFRLKQHSSYNRKSKTPDDEKGWFANADLNSEKNKKNKNYIREEKNAKGETEWVLMDHQSAGALVRVWMPSSHTKGSIVRFYLDGAKSPSFETSLYEFFSGDGKLPYPFAHKSLLSAVSFFPIAYAKGCKITVSKKPFFFQYTFREYTEGTEIKTFELADLENNKSLIKEVGEQLLHPKNVNQGDKYTISATLSKKQEKSVDLPRGTAAIRTLKLKLGDYTSDPEVTRKVILKIDFDGKQTVWTPIGDFFGTGIGLHPYQGWDHTVAKDGTLSCRWVMPYQKTAKISVLNLNDNPIKVELEAIIGDWQWDKQSLYFHAGWRGQYPVPTRPRIDWNYVTLKGRGVFVGDALTTMNPFQDWWGEGDEKIWVDGEDFPSMFGTGTEDYYGYSWGGKATDFYEHPFHAQPRSHIYDQLNRKPQDKLGERNTAGYNTELRNRALDVIPFSSSLQLDMEVWAKKECDMGYGVGVYWYGDANTTTNSMVDEKEACNIPPLPNPIPLGSQSTEAK